MVAFLIPQITFAAWWNPISWLDRWFFSRNSVEKTQIIGLEGLEREKLVKEEKEENQIEASEEENVDKDIKNIQQISVVTEQKQDIQKVDVDVCSNIEGIQRIVPDNHSLDFGVCVDKKYLKNEVDKLILEAEGVIKIAQTKIDDSEDDVEYLKTAKDSDMDERKDLLREARKTLGLAKIAINEGKFDNAKILALKAKNIAEDSADPIIRDFRYTSFTKDKITTITFSWTTDEDTYSTILYSVNCDFIRKNRDAKEISDGNYSKEHNITLDLEDRNYLLVIRAEDEFGNVEESKMSATGINRNINYCKLY